MKKRNTFDPNQTILDDTRSAIKDSNMQPYLVIFIGQDSGKRHKLEPGSMTIGRSPEADIILEDDWASRVHCAIHWKDDVFELEDRDSTNGTYLNTHKIRRVQVPPGVPIQVGHSLLKIEFKDKAELQLEQNLHRMIDFDHFKLINDTHGHQMGDFVLNRFASIINACKRPEDIFARYGGEEFIILPRGNLSREGMHFQCERLRRTIEAAEFAFGETCVQITISLGSHLAMVTKGDPEPSIDDWIGKADEALYRAKDLGRNRVENLD